jgi:cytoskeletal protein CcmA (bactofilin family)
MIRSIAAFLFGLTVAASALADDGKDDTIRIGGNVEVSEPTNGSLHAIGGRVRIDAPVAGALRVAGGKIEIGHEASIDGSASLAGGSITVRGAIQGDLNAAGGQIILEGPVAGDVSVAGGKLTIGPDARIAGKVKFRGGELEQDPAALVAGGTEHKSGRSHRHENTADEHPAAHALITTGVLAVLAALLAGGLPVQTRQLAQELAERRWLTPLLGFLAITAIPIAAVLTMVTIIGIPLGIVALVLYAVLLLAGYVWLAVVVGGMLLDRYKPETAQVVAWRVGAAVFTVVVLALVVRVPFLGGLAKFAALLVGVGMIVGVVLRRVQPPVTKA